MSWCLYATNSADQWMLVGRFDRLSDAAQRIGEFEGMPGSTLYLEAPITPGVDDDEALALFQYSGIKRPYAIRYEIVVAVHG